MGAITVRGRNTESHAASFALIAWASGWLKVHHPAAFLAGLLNAWPMGFYHPATLVKDAQHHGTDVLPIDVTRSGRLCRVERLGGPWPKHLPRPAAAVVTPGLAVRLGLRYVRGLRASTADAIEREAARAPFAGVKDLARRAALREDELQALAQAGAFASLPDAATGERGLSRRTALWQAAAARDLGLLYDTLEDETGMCQAILRPDLFRENRALVVEGRLQKKDGTLSIRAERFERMNLEEPIPELRKPVSPPYPRHRESTPQGHGCR